MIRDKTLGLTKRVNATLNTKSKLEHAVRDLQKRIDESIVEFNEYVSADVLSQSKVQENIEYLNKCKESVQRVIIDKHIGSLTEATCPPKPDSENPNKDEIIKIRIEYQKANRILKEYEDVHKQLTLPLTIKVELRERYESLISSFGPDLKEYTLPKIHERDTVLQRSLKKQREMKNTFIKVNRRITSNIANISKSIIGQPEKLKHYQDAISELEFYKQTFQKIREEIETRIETLNFAEPNYEKAVARKNSLIEASKKLLKDTRLTEARRKYLELIDLSFQSAHDSLKKMAGAPLVRSKKPTSFEEMEKVTAVYNKESDLLTFNFATLNEKIEAIPVQVNELTKKTGEEIEKEYEGFKLLAVEIKKQLKDAMLTESINIALIEQKFNQEIERSNVQNLNPLTFAKARLSELQKITEELKVQIGVEQERLRNKLNMSIKLVESEIKVKRTDTLRDIKKGQFNFNSTEQEVVNKIAGYAPYAAASIKGIDALKQIFENVTKHKREIDGIIEALQTIIKTHKAAKNLIAEIVTGKISALDVAKKINESAHGSELLSAMSRYSNEQLFNEEQLVKILNMHLAQFDTKGILAVKDFVEHTSVSSKDGVELRGKLAFIDVLTANGINYNSLFATTNTNVNVIPAVLHLKNLNQTAFISEGYLRNKAFCDAVVMLKEQEIALNKEILSALASDPNKCAVIKQQIEQYQRHKDFVQQEYESELDIPAAARPLEESLFKALLLDFLKVTREVAKAVNAIIEGKKANGIDQGPVRECPHWLVVSVKEDPKLQGILTNDQELDANIQFLGPIFEQSDIKNIFLANYLSENEQDRIASQYPFITRSESNQLLLAQLEKANNNELGPIFDLKKMGIVMKKINEFVTDQESKPLDKATLDSLKAFRNEVIPILLSSQKPNEKQKSLESLADSHFKQTCLFERMMECIVEAFQSILPAKLLSSAQQSFFSTQKISAVNQIRKGFEQPTPADEESEVDIKETDPLIPKGINK